MGEVKVIVPVREGMGSVKGDGGRAFVVMLVWREEI